MTLLPVLKLTLKKRTDDVIYIFYIIRADEWCVKMQERVASVDDYQFDIEIALSKQLGAKPLPFVGMDSKQFYIKTTKSAE